MMNCVEATDAGAVLRVRVIPRASRNAVDGLLGDALKVRLQAPPVEGKANRALLKLLSELLGTPAAHLTVLQGDRHRNKRVLVRSMDAAAVTARLAVQFAD